MVPRLYRKLFHKFGAFYCQRICKKEYESQKIEPNERLVEYRFVFQSLLRACPSTILDVGTGVTSLPHLLKTCGFVVTAIDNMRDYWGGDILNRHYYLIDDDITNTKIAGKFDFITCVSTLEHIEKYDSAVKSMFNLLNPGGHLVMTFPYNETQYIENVYKLPEAGFGKHVSYICRVYSRNELNNWLKKSNGKIVDQEYWQSYTGNFWTFGEKLCQARQVDKHEKHQLTCILIKKQGEIKCG